MIGKNSDLLKFLQNLLMKVIFL